MHTFAFSIMNNLLMMARTLIAGFLLLSLSALIIFVSPAQSKAATPHLSRSSHFSAPLPVATIQGRAKAVLKDLEGQTQESLGEITGDQADRAIGVGKQIEAKLRNTLEDVKDSTGLG